MTRFFYIICIFLLGFTVKPGEAYACGSKSEKKVHACSNPGEVQKNNTDCSKSDRESCGSHGTCCHGNCDDSNCQCPSSFINHITSLINESYDFKIIFSVPDFYYQSPLFSSGFHLIWLPPKIG